MRRAIKIGIAVVAVMAVLPIVLIIITLFVGRRHFTQPQFVPRKMQLANRGSLIIDGNARGRSEHGHVKSAITWLTCLGAAYRPPESARIEWFERVGGRA